MIDSSFKFAGIAGAMALAISASVVAQDAVQWRVEDGGNGHWYAAVRSDGLITFHEARYLAVEAGGDLAVLKGPDENDWVFGMLASNREIWWEPTNPRHGPWIGLRQDLNAPDYEEPSGGWQSVDGTAVTFTNWASATTTCEDMPRILSCDGIRTQDFGAFFCPEEGPSSCPDPTDTWASLQANHPRMESYLIEWSADCNGDGIADYGQILDGTMFDGDENGIPDCCELGYDCELNLVHNGSFENGPDQADCTWTTVYPGDINLIPWTVTQSSVDRLRLSTTCTNESWQSFQGEFTVDLDGFSTAGGIEQVISTDIGRRYALSLQLTGNCGPNIAKRIRVSAGDWVGEFETNCQPTNPQPWRPVSMSFTAASRTTTVRLESLSKTGINGPVIDDVRVSPYACMADLNGDGIVGPPDLGILLAVWGTDGGDIEAADINGDGTVNASDLGPLLGAWGPCP